MRASLAAAMDPRGALLLLLLLLLLCCAAQAAANDIALLLGHPRGARSAGEPRRW